MIKLLDHNKLLLCYSRETSSPLIHSHKLPLKLPERCFIFVIFANNAAIMTNDDRIIHILFIKNKIKIHIQNVAGDCGRFTHQTAPKAAQTSE